MAQAELTLVARHLQNNVRALGQGQNQQTPAAEFGTNSSYFRLTSFVTIGAAEFNLYSLMYQDAQGSVRPLLRSYTPD